MSKRRSNQIDLSGVQSLIDTSEVDWDRAMQLHQQECKIRGLTEGTKNFYYEMVMYFKRDMERFYDIHYPRNITLQHIKLNIEFYIEKGNSSVTINARLRAIRSFFNFLHQEGYVPKNPVENLKLLKEEKKMLPTFSKDQIKNLLDKPDMKTFTGFRDYTMMLLLLETGARANELLDIKVSDIHWDDDLVIVKGKNREERKLPIQERVKRQLENYMKIRGDVPETDVLFLTIDDTDVKIRSFQMIVRNYGKEAGINDVRVSPHTLRHTFAKFYIQNGGDVFTLQRILGHSSLEMVRKYVNMFSADVADAHKKYSPVESIF